MATEAPRWSTAAVSDPFSSARCFQAPFVSVNTYAVPAYEPWSGAPTTAVVPERATAEPKVSPATVSEPFSSALCFQAPLLSVNTLPLRRSQRDQPHPLPQSCPRWPPRNRRHRPRWCLRPSAPRVASRSALCERSRLPQELRSPEEEGRQRLQQEMRTGLQTGTRSRGPLIVHTPSGCIPKPRALIQAAQLGQSRQRRVESRRRSRPAGTAQSPRAAARTLAGAVVEVAGDAAFAPCAPDVTPVAVTATEAVAKSLGEMAVTAGRK